MENEEINVDKEQLIHILAQNWDETELALWAYDCTDDAEDVIEEILESNPKDQLWYYLDEKAKREIAGDTLFPRYSAIKIIESILSLVKTFLFSFPVDFFFKLIFFN